eukprot:214118-Rhodomonas_salina.1
MRSGCASMLLHGCAMHASGRSPTAPPANRTKSFRNKADASRFLVNESPGSHGGAEFQAGVDRCRGGSVRKGKQTRFKQTRFKQTRF